jgi:hypothetical protein
MRTQYHFRPGKTGLDAWDIHRLVALTAEFPVKEIDLSEIWEVDSVYWFNDGDELPTVRNVVEHMRLVGQVDLSYPITLGANGCVMDGMHRVVRALLDGHRTIKAVAIRRRPRTGLPRLPTPRSALPTELTGPKPAYGGRDNLG